MVTSTKRALVWSFAERYAGLLIALASTMILARLLTPAQVGIYSLCAAFTAVAGILRDFGVSEYLIQERELTIDKIRAAFGLAILVAWSMALFIFLARMEVADFYSEPRVADVLLVLTVNFLLLPLSSPAFALMNRELAFGQIFWLQLACNGAQALTSVGLAIRGHGVMALAWGPVANVATQTALLLVLRPRQTLVLPSLRNSQHVLKFGSMYVGSRVLEVVARNTHEPLLAKQFGFESVGMFSRAFGLIEIFNSTISAAVIRVTTPAFAAASREGASVATAFSRATGMYVSVSWTFFGFVAVMSEPIIRIMFGAQWVAAAPIATVLAIGALPAALNSMAPQMLSATGHVAKRLRLSMVFCAIHVVCVIAASQLTLIAVAWVWFVSMSAIALLYASTLRQIFAEPIKVIYREAARGAGVAILSVAAQWVVAMSLGAAQVPTLPHLLLVAVAGVLSWAASARWLRDPTLDQLRALIRHACARSAT